MPQKELGVEEPIIRRKYHTLDGIRGVAALMVLVRHVGSYFGDFGLYLSKAESYLAVDLFFVLSGFVISEAYDRRLAGGLSPGEFIKIRIIRLYPLYLLGFITGTVVALGYLLLGNNALNLTGLQIAKDFTFCLFMLPSPFSVALYPVCHQSWSIFFEIIANGLYAIAYPFLTKGKLISVITVSGIGLGICAFQNGDTDGGNDWTGFIVAIFRVVYSFGAGVLIHRLHKKIQTVRIPSWILLGLVLILLSGTPSSELRPWYDMLVVILLFPAIVHIAAVSESGSEKVVRVYSLLGTTSYAVYILHGQFADIFAGVFLAVFKLHATQFTPFSGFVFLFSLVYFCWLLDKVYDMPVRRWATSMFLKKILK